MRILVLPALLLTTVMLAGCDDGPFPYVFVGEGSITLANTHGNYPPGWAPWGHVMLTYEELDVQDLSEGKSKGIRVHQLLTSGSWLHIDTDRFGITHGGPGKITLEDPGNYSISDIERGSPGQGVHVNVTVLTSEQGCMPSSVGRICEDHEPPENGTTSEAQSGEGGGRPFGTPYVSQHNITLQPTLRAGG